MIVRLLVASVKFRVGRAFSPTLGALQTRPLHQLSLVAAGLDAKTCMQTKKKRGGAGESWSPLRQAGRAPPAALRREGVLLAGFSPDLWFFFHPNTTVHTPSQPSLK